MEPVSAILILCPILVPYVKSMGIDLVHFGLIMVLTLMIGLLTPPVRMVLYVLQRDRQYSLRPCSESDPSLLDSAVDCAMHYYRFPRIGNLAPRLAMG